MSKIKIIIISLLALSLFAFLTVMFRNEEKSEGIIETVTEEDLDGELRSKIGQMLIVGFRGTEVNDESSIIKAINELNLGGVILFDYDVPSRGMEERNIINPNQVKKLISDIKETSPLFVAVDAEGGYINRLKERDGFNNIPSAKTMSQGSPEETEEYGHYLGEMLSDLGFNLNFAPVVDLNINPDNPIIGKLERSFSDDSEKVAIHALNFIKGLNRYGIISAIKHFPGHGSSRNDSHLGLVDITETYKEEELLPYRIIVSAGYTDMVMTAHVINRNIDPDYPATLSSSFLKDILRNDIGFEGVIISDDMQMGAITDNYGYEEAIIRSVNAGCDIIIISNNGSTYNEEDYYRAVEIIFNAVKIGEIEEMRINESYERITSLKERYGILSTR